MCGIVGLVDESGVEERLLVQMRDALFHRGPDDMGVWISVDRAIGLAHRRLSITDLSKAGRQPMPDGEAKIWITYNGEIYNFRVIRKELQDRGYIFTSQTDTEVILNAYKEWGTDCLQRFNGMFAFGIYDDRRKTIFLARDRVGKKPLYYTHDRSRLAFASELKALLQGNTFPRELDVQALNFYLTFGYISGDLCIFRAIRKLPPAHAMIYNLQTAQLECWRYWEPPLAAEQTRNKGELLEELEALLEDAVRLRMISDVPLGAFLSGGIDSSLVVAMMSRVSDGPVKTFSIGFEESHYNELSHARIVANHFRTDHHEVIVKPDAFSILPDLVRQFDEPFADSSMIPTYYVSKATKEYVTVALSGDGGDELFGGYSHYVGTLMNQYATKFLPASLRQSMAWIAESLPEMFVAKRHGVRLKLDPYSAFIDRTSFLYFKEDYRQEILNGEIRAGLNPNFYEPETSRLKYLGERDSDLINRMVYTDFKTYLPDDILVKVDRTSMLESLEVRSPLLDYRIAEFSFERVPGHLKVKRTITKYLLKTLARQILPKELDINRKWGFVVPVAEWFRGPLFPQLRETLLENNEPFFNQSYINKLITEHKEGKDHSGRLFILLVFSLWKNEYLRL